jgi:hypothetical protein
MVNGPSNGGTSTPPTKWRVTVFNPASPVVDDDYTIYVICASP